MPDEGRDLPSTELSPADRRAREITEIQRDIAKRRRRKLALLVSRLMAFVILPTILVGYYYAAVATPMYATKSAFLILSADGGGSGGGGGGLGGLLPSQFATGQDAIATQEYLESKDAMLRLDDDVGFRAHFSQPWIDPLQRLDPAGVDRRRLRALQQIREDRLRPDRGRHPDGGVHRRPQRSAPNSRGG